MAHDGPEKNRERALAWYYANRNVVLEQRRQSYWQDPEKARQRARTWRENHPERAKEIDREASRRKKRMNPDGERDRFRRMGMAQRHGMRPEDWAALWDAQDGQCYLCGTGLDALPAQDVHLDHDHLHCPRNRSCGVCRRGLACKGCNQSIGLAGDDPDRMERMAANLKAAKLAVERRKAVSAQQLPLPGVLDDVARG